VKTFVRIKKYKLVAPLVADSNVSLLELVFVTKPKKKKVVIDVFTSGSGLVAPSTPYNALCVDCVVQSLTKLEQSWNKIVSIPMKI